jgi:hypothetical protein
MKFEEKMGGKIAGNAPLQAFRPVPRDDSGQTVSGQQSGPVQEDVQEGAQLSLLNE